MGRKGEQQDNADVDNGKQQCRQTCQTLTKTRGQAVAATTAKGQQTALAQHTIGHSEQQQPYQKGRGQHFGKMA